jgi:hypothetical protein
MIVGGRLAPAPFPPNSRPAPRPMLSLHICLSWPALQGGSLVLSFQNWGPGGSLRTSSSPALSRLHDRGTQGQRCLHL